MEEKIDVDKSDDVLMPGFRFHPTDEELVGFYLKRKIQQRPLPIELIKQVDIYKYDPWDLPTLATTGEKEWYFYCPRDRKYRNSTRPNRVTGAGFWKATGTDRPIYSSDGTKCIGLKKSLVFYRGRAAKGIKTDWMMHEFRLPSIGEPSPPKKLLDKSLPANDAWAICRIFKKTNSMAQRALSHSWITSFPESSESQILNNVAHCNGQFSSENISCTTEAGSAFQICSNNSLHQSSTASFSALDLSAYKSISPTIYKPCEFPLPNPDINNSSIFLPLQISDTPKCTVDDSPSIFLSPCSNIGFDESNQQFNGFSMQENNIGSFTQEDSDDQRKNGPSVHDGYQMETIRSLGFPFSLQQNLSDSWKSNNMQWDSPNTPSEMSTTYSTSKCYT